MSDRVVCGSWLDWGCASFTCLQAPDHEGDCTVELEGAFARYDPLGEVEEVEFVVRWRRK